jgi:hypothetical protein
MSNPETPTRVQSKSQYKRLVAQGAPDPERRRLEPDDAPVTHGETPTVEQRLTAWADEFEGECYGFLRGAGVLRCVECEAFKGDAHAEDCESSQRLALLRQTVADYLTLQSEADTLRAERDAFRDEANVVRRNLLAEIRDLAERADAAEAELARLRAEQEANGKV